MSTRTLPLVFINLGGEMLYILDQRLRALNTSEDQSETVLNDVVGTMFSRSFMEELLKPQPLYSHRTTKTVLTRLAHSSIMRLNPASMDRVSVFLKNQVQKPSGRFVLMTSGPVPAGVHVPGLIRTFDPRGREVGRSEFPPGGTYSGSVGEGSFELSGDRILRLGQNLYQAERPAETQTSRTPGAQPDRTDPLAKEELNLLARLLGCMRAGPVPAAAPRFRISLFASDPEQQQEGGAPAGQAAVVQVIHIQAVQDEEAASALARIAGQFTDEEAELENPSGSKGDDLLAMMDDL